MLDVPRLRAACAREGARLVVDATQAAGILKIYRSRGDPVPVVADYSVVCDGAGAARCVLQTTEVRILAFEDVDAAFAADEGEGDRSLASWREDHLAYFQRELADLGLSASPRMLLVCERFRLLYTAPSAT